jgi:hypothetical protein
MTQVMALVAMEEPTPPTHEFGPEASSAIRNAKVEVIKQIKPIDINDVVVRMPNLILDLISKHRVLHVPCDAYFGTVAIE